MRSPKSGPRFNRHIENVMSAPGAIVMAAFLCGVEHVCAKKLGKRKIKNSEFLAYFNPMSEKIGRRFERAGITPGEGDEFQHVSEIVAMAAEMIMEAEKATAKSTGTR